jgi:hypothetical protein
MSYPFFSKISLRIFNNIQTHGKASISTSLNKSTDASSLVTWMRVISGTGGGLIMSSNPDIPVTSEPTFDKANKSWMHSPSSHGSRLVAGMIGYDWDGVPVYPYMTPVGGDLVLRPSPIITAFEVKEGKDQISRQATLVLKCFSLAQCEIIQKYLMEPGHSLLVEYGWNTDIAEAQLIDISNPNDIVNQAADNNLNYVELHGKRLKSAGDYDSYFGFIVGGSTVSEGDSFIINVKLRGMPGMPTFLQGQHTVNRLVDIKDAKGNILGKKTSVIPTAQTYSVDDIEAGVGSSATTTSSPIAIGLRRYKWMFNNLPPIRQIPQVKALVDNVKKTNTYYGWWDLINFDAVVLKDIQKYTTGAGLGGIDKLKRYFGLVKEITVGDVTIEKDKLVSEEKYINFGLVLAILNANNGLYAYKVGNKDIKVTIDTTGFIGSFPGIFSTKAKKLIIPGKIPDFYNFYLNTALVDVNEILNPAKFVNNGIIYTRGGKNYNLAFTQDYDLDGLDPTTKKPIPNYTGYYESANYYGRIDHLYINFEIFKNAVSNSSNKSLKDVLMTMLNEMSSAVNSFWNFQLIESTSDSGDVSLQIIDDNWAGNCELTNKGIPATTEKPIKEFYHSGEQSVFLEAELDIDIPAEMTNMIILRREDYVFNQDAKPISMGGIFSEQSDKFFTGIDYRATAVKVATPKPPAPSGGDPYGYRAKSLNELKDAKNAWKKTLIERPRSFKDQLADALSKSRVREYENSSKVLVYTDRFTSGAGLSGGIKSENGGPNVEGQKWDDLLKVIDEKEKEAAAIAKTNLSANLGKINIVPNPEKGVVNGSSLDVTSGTATAESLFRQNFRIYCCDDTQLFDILKNNAYEANKSSNKTSILLPIKYRFKILGKSGLRRGDVFNIWGIPKKYRDNGFFQIVEIEQTLQGNSWTTNITGQYRQVG